MVLRESIVTGNRVPSSYGVSSAPDIAGHWQNTYLTDHGWSLESIDLFIFKLSGVTADVVLTLYNTDATPASFSEMGYTSVPASSVPTGISNITDGDYVNFAFSSPIIIPAGTRLAAILSTPSATTNSFTFPLLSDSMPDGLIHKLGSDPWAGPTGNVGFRYNGTLVDSYVPRVMINP